MFSLGESRYVPSLWIWTHVPWLSAVRASSLLISEPLDCHNFAIRKASETSWKAKAYFYSEDVVEHLDQVE